mgnify:CR=1 FL=1
MYWGNTRQFLKWNIYALWSNDNYLSFTKQAWVRIIFSEIFFQIFSSAIKRMSWKVEHICFRLSFDHKNHSNYPHPLKGYDGPWLQVQYTFHITKTNFEYPDIKHIQLNSILNSLSGDTTCNTREWSKRMKGKKDWYLSLLLNILLCSWF